MTTNLQSFGARMFAVADTLDVEKYVNYLAPDVYFRFGNAEPSPAATPSAMPSATSSPPSRACSTPSCGNGASGDTIIQQLDVTYTRLDGNRVTLPAVNILRLNNNTVADYRIYVDLAPVYA